MLVEVITHFYSIFTTTVAGASLIEPSLTGIQTDSEIGLPLSLNTIAMQGNCIPMCMNS